MSYSRAGLFGHLAESASGVQSVESCACSDIYRAPEIKIIY